MATLNEGTGTLGAFEQSQQSHEKQWLEQLQSLSKEEMRMQVANQFVNHAKLDAIFRDTLTGMFSAYGYWLLSTGTHTWAVQHLDKSKDNVGYSERFDNLADAITYIFEDMGGTRCRSQE